MTARSREEITSTAADIMFRQNDFDRKRELRQVGLRVVDSWWRIFFCLNDSAARPQGDLAWSSRHFSALPEYVDASFWMSISRVLYI